MDEIEKISVVIATYNGEKYLREQLESVLNQTYPIYEILIKDDCSTDGTEKIILEYTKRYSKIRYVKNKENVGVWQNFLEGFFLALGELIAYCDQDDIWLSNKIERMIPYIKGRNLVYCNSMVCDSMGHCLYKLRQKSQLVSEITSTLDLQVWGHQMLFRKDILYKEKVELLYRQISLDALLPIIAFQGENNNVYYLAEELVYWRRHLDTYTMISRRPPLLTRGTFGLFSSVFSYWNKEKRKGTRAFFSLLKQVRGFSDVTKKVVNLMANCSFFDVCVCSYLCAKDYLGIHQKVTNREIVRLFFKPFIAIRCQLKYIGNNK